MRQPRSIPTRTEALLHTIIMLAFLHIIISSMSHSEPCSCTSTSVQQMNLSAQDPLFIIEPATGDIPIRRRRQLTQPQVAGLRWAIFSPPKPFHENPDQIKALTSWLGLRVRPKIFLIESDDVDFNHPEIARVRNELLVQTVKCKSNADGLLLQNSIFEEASKAADVDVVVVLNSDIILGNDFLDALEVVEGYFDRFLMVGARYDGQSIENVTATVDHGFETLSHHYRSQSLQNGALHTYGGTDYYAWRPVGDPSLAAIGGRIPPFTYGRGKADNWIVKMAVQNGFVNVIDASTAVMAIHPAHGYKLSIPDENTGGNGEQYVNYWSAKPSGDNYIDFNKHLAYTFGSFFNGEGTPLTAPWQVTRCIDIEAPRQMGLMEKACLRFRLRPGSCPCEHNPYVPRTLTEVEVQEKHSVCAHSPLQKRETFDEHFVLQGLLRQQAETNTVILFGFNHGYHDMLLNIICRLQQLQVSNYVIAAFDPDAYSFCRQHVLPCYPVSQDIAIKSKSKGGLQHGASAHEFGSQQFRALTKLKSQQVLRILELGYNVLWSDVDIFWKTNALEKVRLDIEAHDIAVQSNAPPDEKADNGHRRINSGFYFVKQSATTIDAFRQIVGHANSTNLSEQPSFYTILCGDKMEHAKGRSQCFNDNIGVSTTFLDRERYPNGAVLDAMKNVTPESDDNIAILHFNWRVGDATKIQSFVNASAWFLTEDLNCRI